MNVDDEQAWLSAEEYIADLITQASQREPTNFPYLGLDPHLRACVKRLDDLCDRLNDAPSFALKIATYGHDVERALPNRIKLGDYDHLPEDDQYFAYKKDHAEHSANVVCGHLVRIGANQDLVRDVQFLITEHDTDYVVDAARELGEAKRYLTRDLVILKAVDSLSFFYENLAAFVEQHSAKPRRITSKINFMFEKACGRTPASILSDHVRNCNGFVDDSISELIAPVCECAEQLAVECYRSAREKYPNLFTFEL